MKAIFAMKPPETPNQQCVNEKAPLVAERGQIRVTGAGLIRLLRLLLLQREPCRLRLLHQRRGPRTR